jgi:UDP-glucose:(heptosyl)LPS alpha-1,3-glucosyltransferase
MVVLEAMAYGLPVVVSSGQYCGAAQLLADKVNALVLTNPHDASALVSALNAICQNKAVGDALSTAALSFTRSYLWSAMALRQEAIYLSN